MNTTRYTPSPIPEYAGNPLIEALPPVVRDDSEVNGLMAVVPQYSPSERDLPREVRLELVPRVESLFVPAPAHFEMYERIVARLRRSYTWRNPLDPEIQGYLHRTTDAAYSPETLSKRSSSGSLFFVKGISGAGKSKGVEACLRAIGASVIRHEAYCGQAMIETQIVWLKISCPEDRSMKSLCAEILMAADAALGYEGRWAASYLDDPRVTIGQLKRGVFKLIANNHVGILVVDELQNLFASEGQPAVDLINFLLRVRDESGICLVLCGTYAALGLLQVKFRLSRRVAGGGGGLEMRRSDKASDEDWMNLCEILWGYQWLAKPTRFDARVARTLQDLTQGIKGVAVPLFEVAQEDAIRAGEVGMTVGRLRSTWRSSFFQLDSAMAALRRKDVDALSRWDDLCDSGVLAQIQRRTAPVGKQTAPVRDGRRRIVDPELSGLKNEGGLESLRRAGVLGLPGDR